jgi:hypothetical protein
MGFLANVKKKKLLKFYHKRHKRNFSFVPFVVYPINLKKSELSQSPQPAVRHEANVPHF